MYSKKYSLIYILILFVLPFSGLAQKSSSIFERDPHLASLIVQANDSVLTPSCIPLARELYNQGRDRGEPVAQCIALQLMSICYFSEENLARLQYVVEECKKTCSTDECAQSLYGTWNNLVAFYLNQNNLTPAIDQLNAMQKFALEHSHNFGIMKSYIGLGNCYSILKEYVKAYEQYNYALEFKKQKGLPIAGSDYVNMAQNAIQIRQYDHAEQLLNEAVSQDGCPEFLRIQIYSLLFNIYSQSDHQDRTVALKYKQLLESERLGDADLVESAKIAYNEAYYNYYTYVDTDYVKAEKYIMVDTDSMLYYLRKANNMNLQKKTIPANAYYKQAVRFYYNQKDEADRNELESFAAQNNMDRLLTERNKLELKNIQLQRKWERIFIISSSILIILIVSGLCFFFFRRMRQMRLRKEQAEISEHRKMLFLQNMSHEIRTPLNAIVGFADLLTGEIRDTIEPEEHDMMVGLIRTNSELLGTLVNDVLDVSKYESGTYQLHLSDANVYQLCRSAVETVRSRVAEGVVLDYVPGDKNLILHTDAQRVEQVLINFLTNACKYTEKGRIELSYRVVDQMVRFTVSDTGKGIKAEDAESVFQRFQMLDTKVSGTGLGLHICRLVSQLLKGRVYVDTAYTRGARFVFEHPRNSDLKEA